MLFRSDQTAYLSKVLQRFGMTNARSAVTPLPSGYSPVANSAPIDPDTRHKFQQLIGSLVTNITTFIPFTDRTPTGPIADPEGGRSPNPPNERRTGSQTL